MIFVNLLNRLIMNFGSNSQKIKYAQKGGVIIGNDCTILGRPDWGSEPYLIEIGDNVRITSGVQFVTHDGGVHVIRNAMAQPKADVFGKIKIGNNVFIGLRSIIMPNVTIGDNVVIGAGSIVTRDIPSNSVCCGVPARKVRTLEEYYERISPNIVPTKGMKMDEKRAYLEAYFNKCAGKTGNDI